MSEQQPKQPGRKSRFSDAFREFIPTGWAPYPSEPPARLESADWAAKRRAEISARFPGERLIIPAGGLKVRNNDCDYLFRPHSAFAHLTGLGADREPDAVLVLEPTDAGHDAELYFKPRAPRTDEEFYADARYGEMWVGTRESLSEMESMTGLSVADIADLRDALAKNAQSTVLRIIRDADAELAAYVDSLVENRETELDDALATALSELRLTKDDYELDQMRLACAETAKAFEAVVADLPEALRRGRGERWVEGIFGLHARHTGNGVGYSTIAASGDNACTLHWVRNDGEMSAGDLLLLDAGIEVDSLYTADITRTLPASGKFSDAQRKVYQAVLEAQQAGIDAAKPGADYLAPHRAAIEVIAKHLREWGMLPVSVEEALSEDGGQWRRWMVHGTSHHLGLDVHDCAQARNEFYREGKLEEGMVITVEPGIYIKETDLLAPEELRGIGVRIEDDIVITADGCEILSHHLPRSIDDIESWMAKLLKG